jgi:hypothetical protein
MVLAGASAGPEQLCCEPPAIPRAMAKRRIRTYKASMSADLLDG